MQPAKNEFNLSGTNNITLGMKTINKTEIYNKISAQ